MMQPADIAVFLSVQNFLIAESAALDRNDWDTWLSLFTADGVYWMPAEAQQTSPVNHVSLIHDDAILRELRYRRFRGRSESGAISLQPHPRSLRCLSNITLVEHTPGNAIASANVILAQYAQTAVQTFYAQVRWDLHIEGERFLIRQKRVDLLNCDGLLSDILVYL